MGDAVRACRVGACGSTRLIGKGRLGVPPRAPRWDSPANCCWEGSGEGDPPGRSVHRRSTLGTEPHAWHVGPPEPGYHTEDTGQLQSQTWQGSRALSPGAGNHQDEHARVPGHQAARVQERGHGERPEGSPEKTGRRHQRAAPPGQKRRPSSVGSSADRTRPTEESQSWGTPEE